MSGKTKEDYQNLIDGMNDSVFVHDLDGNFLAVNDAAAEKLEYTKEKLLEMEPQDINTPRYAEKVEERNRRISDDDVSCGRGMQKT